MKLFKKIWNSVMNALIDLVYNASGIILIAIFFLVICLIICLTIFVLYKILTASSFILVTIVLLCLSVNPIIYAAKKLGFKNLIKINSGKYPAPVENPAIHYRRKFFPH